MLVLLLLAPYHTLTLGKPYKFGGGFFVLVVVEVVVVVVVFVGKLAISPLSSSVVFISS